MLDLLLARHLLLEAGRVALALLLFAILAGIGATVLRRVEIDDPLARLLLRIGAGFAVFQCVVRWLAELPLVSRAGAIAIAAAFAILAAHEWRTLLHDIRTLPRPRSWQAVAVLLLLTPPLVMALAPAVSRDALIYHLRFPEMSLRAGRWAHDAATSASFYPAAIGTLYLPALALDPQGVSAQLVHFGFFVLTIAAAGAIARRLGAASGGTAALLVASLPAAAIVAGWAWADAPLLFALAAAALALLANAPALAIVLLALAASIKYTALLAGAPLLVAAVVALARARAFRPLVTGIVAGIAIASPWYVTNALHTGNPIYPLREASHPAAEMVSRWSGDASAAWTRVWSGYFFRPQTLDEDAGGALFLLVAAAGLSLAVARRETRAAAAIAVAMWLPFLPLTAAMRLLLPAVAATLVVSGAALERTRAGVLLAALFAVRGALVTAAHNAHFLNPMPAVAGVESEDAYVRRNFAPAALFARADALLPPDARVLAINEVRLFRFPRPVTASRVLDPPLLRRYVAGAHDVATVVQRMRADGLTHILAAARPVERGGGSIALTAEEDRLVRGVLRASRMLDREGDVALFALPQPSDRAAGG